MRIVMALVSILFFCSCNNDSADVDAVDGDTTYITESSTPSIETPVPFRNLIWSPVYDSVQGEVKVTRQRTVSPDTLTAEKLIGDINNSWEGIRLELQKISNDTIYVAIPQSTVLTQQMGSSGAYSYVSSTTYILTELKNIKYVNFNFEEGDHMSPGTMKRSDFKNF